MADAPKSSRLSTSYQPQGGTTTGIALLASTGFPQPSPGLSLSLLFAVSRWLVSQGKIDKALTIMKKFERINKTKIPDKVLSDFTVSLFIVI